MKFSKARGFRLLSFFGLLFLGVVLSVKAAELPPLREITVKVAASPSFQYDPLWENDIRDRLIFVNKVFESLFNIHFKVILHIPWDVQDETREADLLMEEMKTNIPLERDQIIVGFHKMTQPYDQDKLLDHDLVGSARYFRGLILIRDPFINIGTEGKNIVLLHEVAHLFGAVHISDPQAVMNAVLPAQPELSLDATNTEVIRTTRDVDFTRGIESLSDQAMEVLIQIYERKIRENPHSDFYDQLGRFYQQTHQPAKAVAIWEEALRDHYENPMIHYELGMYYFRSARYAQAIPSLGAAIGHFVLPSQKKMLASTLNLLGTAYYEQGNAELAIFNWLKGLSANPDDATLQGNLAVAYLASGSIDRAVTELEKLLAKNPDDTTTLTNLGNAYLSAKNPQKAVEVLERALAKKKQTMTTEVKKPENLSGSLMDEIPESMIRLNLGAAYLDLKRDGDAIRELEAAKKMDASHYETSINLAQAYLRLGRFDDAIKEIQEALRYKKDNPHLFALLAQAYAGKNQAELAVQAAKEGIRLNPRSELSADLHRNIAGEYLQKQRYSEALDELNIALSIRWKDADAHYLMGILLLQTGKQEQALRSLKTALDINPKHDRAKQVLESFKKKN